MNRQTYNNALIVDYLLGSLSPAETERLDELSFTDDDFAQRLHAVENDLVDAYVRGELHGKLLQRFQSFYLSSPDRLEKVEFAESFLKLADSAEPSVQPARQVWWKAIFRSPRPAWGTLAAAASLLVVLSWLVVQDMRLRRERETLQQRQSEFQVLVGKQQAAAADQQQQIDELRKMLSRLDPGTAPAEPRIIPFVLQAQTRSIGRIAAVSVPAGTDFVTFQLELEVDDYTLYQATLKSIPGGESVWIRSQLRPQARDTSRVVVVTSRASLLKSGNYVLELTGQNAGRTAEPAGSYVFRVEKE